MPPPLSRASERYISPASSSRIRISSNPYVFVEFQTRLANYLEAKIPKRKFHRLERFFGTFERTFTVPEDADTTKIMAEFHDGVLQVHLPKRPIPKPQPIEVKVQ